MKVIKHIFQINATDPFIIVVSDIAEDIYAEVTGQEQETIAANELSNYLDTFLQQQKLLQGDTVVLVAHATNADEITGYGIAPGTKAVTYACEFPPEPPLATFDVYVTNSTVDEVPVSLLSLTVGLYMFKLAPGTTNSGSVAEIYADLCTFINYNADGTTNTGTRQLRQYINGLPMTSALVVTSGQHFDFRTIPGFQPNPDYGAGTYIAVE